MADLLSMPDDVMEHVAEQALWRHDGIRAWCRLASTCSRLWRLKLPRSLNHSWTVLGDVPLEGEYQHPEATLILNCTGQSSLHTLPAMIGQDTRAGLAWALQRVESAPLLRISLLDHGTKYSRTDPETLLRLVGALISATRNIRDVRVLVSAVPPVLPTGQALHGQQKCKASQIARIFAA